MYGHHYLQILQEHPVGYHCHLWPPLYLSFVCDHRRKCVMHQKWGHCELDQYI